MIPREEDDLFRAVTHPSDTGDDPAKIGPRVLGFSIDDRARRAAREVGAEPYGRSHSGDDLALIGIGLGFLPRIVFPVRIGRQQARVDRLAVVNVREEDRTRDRGLPVGGIGR